MKDVIFIGNRFNALQYIKDLPELKLKKVFVLQDSLLAEKLEKANIPDGVPIEVFTMSDKAKLLHEVESTDFDILLSNGCPFILPVSQMKRSGQLYINVHPTLLPDLKGKTPLSGVFLTHRHEIGATMHYIDDGIDTGKIIAQAAVPLTPDVDQGLVYRISFGLEGEAFKKGMKQLITNNFEYVGAPQVGEGSYFNRTPEMQVVDTATDAVDHIIDTVRSFGVKAQGSTLKTATEMYRVFAAEKIQNNYLLKEYDSAKPGTVVLEYDDKLLVRTIDGLIKLTDFETLETEKS